MNTIKITWKEKEIEVVENSVNFSTTCSLTVERLEVLLANIITSPFKLDYIASDWNLFNLKVYPTSLIDVTELFESIMALENIEWVEPDIVYSFNALITNNSIRQPIGPIGPVFATYLPLQWNMMNTGVPILWANASFSGTSTVNVSILDTGIQVNASGTGVGHPDFGGNIILQQNCINPGTPPADDMGHGTAVAGVVAADGSNIIGIAGVNWTSPVNIYKVGSLNTPPASSVLCTAINLAYNNAMSLLQNVVINLSLGASMPNSTLQTAIANIDAANSNPNTKNFAILVAAAGNDGTDLPNYPAAYATTFPYSVISVGATQCNNLVDFYSNYNSSITLVAPGTGILTTDIGSSWAYFTGTSYSAPLVSGIISMLWAMYPNWNNIFMIDILKSKCVLPDGLSPADIQKYGAGIVASFVGELYFTSIIQLQSY